MARRQRFSAFDESGRTLATAPIQPSFIALASPGDLL
jgi:hypothetical protein